MLHRKATLERRIGYTDEELSITRATLATWEINEGKGQEDRDARTVALD